MIIRRLIIITETAACVFALAACSAGPSRPKNPPPPITASNDTEAHAILEELVAGEDHAAKARLKALIKREPMNPSARLLNDSIERDPKELLGPESYLYTVVVGDTIVGIAQRTLGNALKAYQLARYNGLTAPIVLTAGQKLRIPGEPPHLEQPHRPEPTRPFTSIKSVPGRPAAAKPTPVKPTPAAPAKSVANPAAARAARTAGLAALNQGNVSRAVGLLRRAAALDPGNPLIARDLSRAERIAATVKAHQ
ncbi:MAG: LysM peptidoglycan-binding domain-containing protein [Candidatus Eremiobacteraeota bacterium]|nr:LysM peptidoglycan-binding domain-containing protein [Candidatus Eremiobacteraeota bacterium]